MLIAIFQSTFASIIEEETERNGGKGRRLSFVEDHLVHNKPNPHPPKMDVLPKIFLQIILAATRKWIVRDSSSPQNSSDDLCLLLFITLCLL